MLNSFNRKFPTAITYISFCVPFFSLRSLDAYLATYLFFFYEAMIGIHIIFIVIPFLLIRLILPFLQPLLGYLSDRNYPFTRTLGRRFLWIMVSGLLIPIFCVLLFWVPTFNDTIFLIFFTISFLLYNVFYSLYSTSYSALLLNKFRNPKERILIATVTETLSTIGIFIIFFFAPFFINYGDPSSFQFLAIPIAITFLITLLLGIFGLLEEKGLIDTYFSQNQAPKEWFLKDFFKRFAIFKRKNFLVLLFRWIAIALFNLLFLSGLFYYMEYVLDASSFFIILSSFGYYVWFLIALPLSFLLSWYLGHLKVSIISGFAMGTALLAFFFVASILMAVILTSIIGFTLGLGTASLIPLVGDVFDEFANINRKRSEGVAYGILSMFGGFTIISGNFLTIFVYSFTGFIAGCVPQTSLALMGIRILTAIIPGIVIIIAMILFVILYDLKPEKTEAIRMELKELEI